MCSSFKDDEISCRFLLAQLHIDSLVDKVILTDIKSGSAGLPSGSKALDEAYEEAIKRIDSQTLGFCTHYPV